METLTKEIINCQKCQLWQTRNLPLVGEGSLSAGVMIIGEAPGYNEDLQGRAFIGKAGEILDQLLACVNLTRKKIYITNLLKCHPPQNHNPQPDEIKACADYLYRQIKIIQPKIIMTLGKYSSQEIFNKVHLKFSNISKMHGQVFKIKSSYATVNIVPCYHPAVACYKSSMLNTLMQDFKKIMCLF